MTTLTMKPDLKLKGKRKASESIRVKLISEEVGEMSPPIQSSGPPQHHLLLPGQSLYLHRGFRLCTEVSFGNHVLASVIHARPFPSRTNLARERRQFH